jgi:membrane protein YdbS with pleckstrin-like domain
VSRPTVDAVSAGDRAEGSNGRLGHRLDRRVLALWWTVGALLVLVVIGASIGVGLIFNLHPVFPALACLAAAALAAVVPPLRYRRWSYQVRAQDALISRGALFFVQQLIPFDRIQFVESRQGPLDRVFGLTQVVLYTAAGRAGRVPGLSRSDAEALREELARVAGTASV